MKFKRQSYTVKDITGDYREVPGMVLGDWGYHKVDKCHYNITNIATGLRAWSTVTAKHARAIVDGLNGKAVQCTMDVFSVVKEVTTKF